MGIKMGGAHQREGGGGGSFGQLPEGPNTLSFAWETKWWPAGQYGDAGVNLRLMVTGTGPDGKPITEGISSGKGNGVVTLDAGKEIENPTNPDWQLAKGSTGAMFIRQLEKRLDTPIEESWRDVDGVQVVIERDEITIAGKTKTYPRVVQVTGKATGADVPVSPVPRPPGGPEDAQPSLNGAPGFPGSNTAAAQPSGGGTDVSDPLGRKAAAKAAIQSIAAAGKQDGMTKIPMAGMSVGPHLPASVVSGDEKIAVAKLVLDPAHLSTQDGWLYDATDHSLVIL